MLNPTTGAEVDEGDNPFDPTIEGAIAITGAVNPAMDLEPLPPSLKETTSAAVRTPITTSRVMPLSSILAAALVQSQKLTPSPVTRRPLLEAFLKPLALKVTSSVM